KQGVSALELADGNAAWAEPVSFPDDSLPSGQGVLSGNHYYLPLSNASIVQIDLHAGKISRTSRSNREVVAGNLVLFQGRLVSQGAEYLELFDEADPLERRVRDALRDDPRNPRALLELAELELATGQTEQAIQHFREAHEVAPAPHSKNRLIAA